MYSALSTWSLIPTTEIMTDLQILIDQFLNIFWKKYIFEERLNDSLVKA